MPQYRSRLATWFVALLAVTPLGGCRLLVGQDGVGSVRGVDYPPAPPAGVWNTPPATPAQELPEVLSRGPVHEAFAEPVVMQLQAGLVAPDRPPPNIEEIPPAQRPQGQEYVWIPGYWSWDGDRSGYIWVSACWRVAPPRMSWVPGYWAQVSGGWEWVAGFWAPAGVREIEYLPAPPVADDVEPSGPAPSPDTIWVPPCVYWAQGQYTRRAGYWLAAQPNWVWVPSHYVWTPRGYLFAEGHWDYSLERRGVLFAPVYFPTSVYGRSDYAYSPSIVLDLGLLRASLFAYPRYSHYYFGDYYDDAYLSIGIYPWFDSQRLHTWYDPIYEHDRWQNQRSEPRWEERERNDYSRRRADRDLRPARTYLEQEVRLAKLPEPQRRTFQVAQPMAAVVANRATPLKFERITTDAQQKISSQATAVRTFRDQRNRWEAAAESPKTTPPPGDRREQTPPPRESKVTAAPPIERQETVQPPKERKVTASPPIERQETVQQPRERKVAVTPPAERQETVQPPRERKEAATPAAPREPASVPPREAKVRQPERVQIPAPPVVGGSGAPGIFQKGPPSRPADEDKDKDGKDIRKNGGSQPPR